ncbi:hypothetical protein [Sulfuracidifex metallicus]
MEAENVRKFETNGTMLAYVLRDGKLSELHEEIPRPKDGEILVKMRP